MKIDVAAFPAAAGSAAADQNPRWSLDGAAELVVPSTARATIETLKRLKARLLAGAEGPRVFVVTSAVPGDGKSFVALNLALTIARSAERSTILVDADLRKPGVSRIIRPRPTVGLAEVLGQSLHWRTTVVRLGTPPLMILPGGAPPADPAKLLASARMRAVLDDIRSEFGCVVIDTPPVLPFVDADIVGALTDGAVLVVRRGWTPARTVPRAIESLHATRVIGAVLNGAQSNLADRRGYSSGHYHRYYEHGSNHEHKPKNGKEQS